MKHAHIPGASGAAGKNAFRGGTYSLAVAAVVLAILIAVNVFVSALPAARTQYDMSATKLYSVTVSYTHLNRKRKNNLQHIPVPVVTGRTADLSASDESSWDLRLVLS